MSKEKGEEEKLDVRSENKRKRGGWVERKERKKS